MTDVVGWTSAEWDATPDYDGRPLLSDARRDWNRLSPTVKRRLKYEAAQEPRRVFKAEEQRCVEVRWTMPPDGRCADGYCHHAAPCAETRSPVDGAPLPPPEWSRSAGVTDPDPLGAYVGALLRPESEPGLALRALAKSLGRPPERVSDAAFARYVARETWHRPPRRRWYERQWHTVQPAGRGRTPKAPGCP